MVEAPPFDVIVVTSPNEKAARACQEELAVRLARRPGFEEVLYLCVADPQGKRVGSGGGTLNALYHVREALTREGRPAGNAKILLIHSGGDSQRSPTSSVCGKAWNALNACFPDPWRYCKTPLDLLLDQLCCVFVGMPPGSLVVASSDVMLILPNSGPPPYDWSVRQGVTGLACYGPAQLGRNHGVFVTTDQSLVSLYLQKASPHELARRGAVTEDGQVQIDTGVIFFSPAACQVLWKLLDMEPFRGCTTGGVEGGSEPLRLELYSDMLLALSGGVGQSFEEYLRMDGAPPERLVGARRLLWRHCSRLSFWAIAPEGAMFAHLGSTEELMQMMTMQMIPFTRAFGLSRHACCAVGPEVSGFNDAVLVNSVLTGSGHLEEGAILEHCYLRGRWEVGQGSFVSGLYFAGIDINVGPGLCMQETRVGALCGSSALQAPTAGPLDLCFPAQPYVVMLLSLGDNVKAQYGAPEAQVWNLSWPTLFSLTGISADVVWPPDQVPTKDRCIWTARLFPMVDPAQPQCSNVLKSWWWMQTLAAHGKGPEPAEVKTWVEARRLSLSEILALSEPRTEFAWRRSLEREVVQRMPSSPGSKSSIASLLEDLKHRLRAGPLGPSNGPLEEIWAYLPDAAKRQLIKSLEAWAVEGGCGSLFSLASIFAVLAQLLRETSLPNVPDLQGRRDPAWMSVLQSVCSAAPAHTRSVCERLRGIRKNWTGPLDHPPSQASAQGWHLAAMHYELAAYAVVRAQVGTVKGAIKWQSTQKLAASDVVVVETPARIDFAGGWSDTPPISYEVGGQVVNLAVECNGRLPVGASAYLLIGDYSVVLRSRGADGNTVETVCRTLSDFMDHCDPAAPNALLKCAVLYCGVVELINGPSGPLESQLREKLGAGLVVESWSLLPQGSGMGTSSILAGVLLAAVGKAMGKVLDETSLNYAVLEVEQLMTTGGGWQDQVGGLVGGFKNIVSPHSLPLRIRHEPINLKLSVRSLLESHLLLVYTGRQRLARDLLQNVLRRYYARADGIMSTIGALKQNAEDLKRLLKSSGSGGIDPQTGGGHLLQGLGACLDLYWQQKSVMAGGPAVCEPSHVTALMAALRPHVHGMSLCGAGGGGYMVVVTKEDVKMASVRARLTELVEQSLASCLTDVSSTNLIIRVRINDTGLRLSVHERKDGRSSAENVQRS